MPRKKKVKRGGLVINPVTMAAAQKATEVLHGLISASIVYGAYKLATKKKK